MSVKTDYAQARNKDTIVGSVVNTSTTPSRAYQAEGNIPQIRAIPDPATNSIWYSELLVGAEHASIPPGGVRGSVLAKTSEYDYEVEWAGTIVQYTGIACSDEFSDLAVAGGIAFFHTLYGGQLLGVKAGVTNAPEGSDLVVELVYDPGGANLVTEVTILDGTDLGENLYDFDSGDPITVFEADKKVGINITAVGSIAPGTGLKIYLIGG